MDKNTLKTQLISTTRKIIILHVIFIIYVIIIAKSLQYVLLMLIPYSLVLSVWLGIVIPRLEFFSMERIFNEVRISIRRSTRLAITGFFVIFLAHTANSDTALSSWITLIAVVLSIVIAFVLLYWCSISLGDIIVLRIMIKQDKTS